MPRAQDGQAGLKVGDIMRSVIEKGINDEGYGWRKDWNLIINPEEVQADQKTGKDNLWTVLLELFDNANNNSIGTPRATLSADEKDVAMEERYLKNIEDPITRINKANGYEDIEK